MPLITVETSIPASDRAAALATLMAVAERALEIKPPTQVRLRIIDIDPSTALVAHDVADAGNPWLIAHASLLDGRPDAQIERFITEFADAVAACFGADVKHVRVLIQKYSGTTWSIGNRSAAAAGR